MDPYAASDAKKDIKINENTNICYLKAIKSEFFLKKIFFILPKKRLLYIAKYNKQIQNYLNININDYKIFCETYTPIEIEIKPSKDMYGKFFYSLEKKSFFHIYFNDGKEDMKRNYFTEDDKVEKIKLIIDYQILSFNELFSNSNCIESIFF